MLYIMALKPLWCATTSFSRLAPQWRAFLTVWDTSQPCSRRRMRYVCRAVLPAGRPSFVMNSPRGIRGVIKGASDMLCTPCLQCMHAHDLHHEGQHHMGGKSTDETRGSWACLQIIVHSQAARELLVKHAAFAKTCGRECWQSASHVAAGQEQSYLNTLSQACYKSTPGCGVSRTFVQVHKVVISHESQNVPNFISVHPDKQRVCMAKEYLPMPLRYQAALGQPTSPLLLLRRFPALLCCPGCTEHNTS